MEKLTLELLSHTVAFLGSNDSNVAGYRTG
jgi:hypothetical protein